MAFERVLGPAVGLAMIAVLASTPANAQDCNGNGVDDADDLAACTSYDFDDSGVPDECEIAEGLLPDCNGNGIVDYVDIFGSFDFCGNFVGGDKPDCDNNGQPDSCNLVDCNVNGVPDACDIRDNVEQDVDGDGVPDSCALASGAAQDCNENNLPDAADVISALDFDFASYGFNTAGVINPIDLKIGDVNGDNFNDVVAANRSFPNPRSLAVYINNGDGTFADGVIYGPGISAEAVALADLDNDGDLDIALADRTLAQGFGVIVHLNNGNGVYTLKGFFPAGTVPIDVAAGDIDGDNDNDLVVADINGARLAVLRNTGNANFAAPQFIAVGPRPLSVTLADLDGDTDLDVATCVQNAVDVKVLINNGGTFATPVSYPMGDFAPASGAAAADLDSDGDLDLALELQYTRSVGVLRNNGNGTFQPVQGFGPYPGNPVAITVGDFDRSGTADIATTLSPPLKFGAVAILRDSDGTGDYLQPTYYPAGSSPLSIATGDLDNDTFDDLVIGVYQANEIQVMLNRALPPVSDDADGNGVPDECECPADLNNDGQITDADLGLLLNEFGCTSACTADLNNDGQTNDSDLGLLLNVFGTACQ